MYECNPTDWNSQVKENLSTMGADEFFNWFEGGETVDGSLAKGEDIFKRIILPAAKHNLRDLGQKSCVEMGYGNGGMLLAASNTFQDAYGMEWHDCADAIGEMLAKQDHRNLYLVHSPNGINMQDESVDFIYSWLYAQRLGTIENILAFLHDSYRVLKDHGVGIICFPRYIRTGKSQSVKEYEGDVIAENTDRIGYRDGGVTTKVKGISVIVSLWKMKELLSEAGFTVIGQTASYDGRGRGKVYHGQHGLIFRKGEPEPEHPPVEKEVPEEKTEEKAQEPAGDQTDGGTDSDKTYPAKKTKSKKSTSKKLRLKKRK